MKVTRVESILKYLVVIAIMALTSDYSHAQSSLAVDTAEAHEAFEQAKILIDDGRLNQGMPLIKSATKKYKEALGPNHPILLKCYDGVMEVLIGLRHYAELESVARTTLKLINSINKRRTEFEVKTMLNLSIALTELKKFKESELNLVNASNLIKKVPGPHPKMNATILFELGILNKKQRKFDDATNYYLVALEANQEDQDSSRIGNVLYNLGNIEFEKRRHALARYYYKQSLLYYDDNENRHICMAMFAIYLTYQRERAYELAIDYLNLSSLRANKAFGKNHPFSKKLLLRTIQAHNRLEEFGKGIKLFNDNPELNDYAPALLEVAKCHFNNNDAGNSNKYLLASLSPKIADARDSIFGNYFYVKYLQSLGEINKAERLSRSNLVDRKKLYPPTNNKIQYGYFSLAKVLASKKKYDEALYITDTLLASKNNMFSRLQNGDTVQTQVWDDFQRFKIDLLYQKQKLHPNNDNFLLAKHAVEEYLSSLEVVRKNASVPGSHIDLTAGRLDVIDQILDLFYDRYTKQPDNLLIGESLMYMDEVRDMLWVDIVKNRQATDLSEKQIQQLKNENDIRKRIVRIELERQFSADSIQKGNDLAQLKSELGRNANRQYLVNEKAIADGAELLNLIRQNEEIIISYFFSKTSLYRIKVDRQEAILHRIPWNEAEEERLNDFIDLISGQHKDYQNEVNYWSNKLLDGLNFEHNIPIKLYLDGSLHALPFEILNKGTANRTILDDHPISYNTSVKRAVFQYGESNYQNDLIAFAPNYLKWGVVQEDTLHSPALSSLVRFGMTDLPSAKEEVESIANIIGGKSYLEDQATVSNFFNECGNSRILHMSMHAMAESEQPRLSRLIFSPEQQQNQLSRYCFAGEIATQDIPAEMVVLSACNTGRGEYVKGDGVLSLARAFEYAGARSTVFSLWKIPDMATKEIMQEFYKALKENKTKSEALRLAKLNYRLHHANTVFAHPFYWAGFVLNGDSTAIRFNQNWWQSAWSWLAIAVILFIGILTFRQFTHGRSIRS